MGIEQHTVKRWWRSKLDQLANGPNPPGGRRQRVLSLIEHKTTLIIYVIAAAALMLVWSTELAAGITTQHDRWTQPLLAGLMVWLFVDLKRHPQHLQRTQQIAVAAVGLYFLVGTINALILAKQPASPYWIATNFQWMPVVALLMHMTWPWRWAFSCSMMLLITVAAPSMLAVEHASDSAWAALVRSLVINGVLMQMTFLVSLLSVTRLKHGISMVVAGTDDGPVDAREALEAWVQERTAELAQARDQAQAASEAKSRFLAVMSHELRTPLHAMLVSADMLGERAMTPGHADKDALLLKTIHSSGQHLLTLIDQVLELSRIEAGRIEPALSAIDLGIIADKALAAVAPQAQVKGLELRRHISPGLALMRTGDELRLTQILINLLANAIKFTERGHVALSLSALPSEPDQAERVRLSISDTGQGMAPAEQAQVFDAFFQANTDSTRTHGGVGLGLTITRELVTLLQGQIHLESEPAKGTRIDIDLPMPTRAPPACPPRPAVEQKPGHLNGAEVLVVDDDPVNSMLAAEVLRNAGAVVFTADTGAAALAFLRQHTPQMVLMDWRMPDMDGLEATQRLRSGEAGAAAANVPVVGLTANAFAEDRQICLDAGMNNVLTKPVERQHLLSEVHRWLEAPAVSTAVER